MLKGNIKHAPKGEYFAEIVYNSFFPYVVTSKEDKGNKVFLRKVKYIKDGDFFVFNGFEDEKYPFYLLNKEHGYYDLLGVQFVQTDGPFIHVYED